MDRWYSPNILHYKSLNPYNSFVWLIADIHWKSYIIILQIHTIVLCDEQTIFIENVTSL